MALRHISLIATVSHTGAHRAMRSFPAFGSGQKTFGHPAILPILPRNSRGNFSSFWLSQRRWRRDRSSRQKIVWFLDFRNEGTPYRGFGPHTHRKAPVEAQARFSEESHSNSRDWDYCSTAGLHGQARCNSRNLLSVAIDIPVVNCPSAKSFRKLKNSSRRRALTTRRNWQC